MIDSSRNFKTSFGHLVTFDDTSVICIQDSTGDFEIRLDPTDLSLLYNSYLGMKRELLEEELLRSKND